LEAGAFTDDAVVKASEKLVMVKVDCTDTNKVKDVLTKYGVRGFPTMLFMDPDGKVVGRLGARDAVSIARQFNELSTQYRKTVAFADSVEAALATGKTDGKPVLALFTDKSKDAEETETALADDSLQAALARFVAARHEIAKDCELCKRCKAVAGVTVLVLDPRNEDPAAAPLAQLAGKRTAAALKTGLESALKKWDAAAKTAAGGTVAPPAAAGPAAVPAPAVTDVEKQCRMWLMLARNFFNQRELARAEENVKRVLEKMPEGKLAEEAKALQKEIDAAK
jgi:hypothetical protein